MAKLITRCLEALHLDMDLPADLNQQEYLFTSIRNVMPAEAELSDEFLQLQDAYLQEKLRSKHITDIAELTPLEEGIYLWQGDITTLKVDAIVNAANSQLLGCFVPHHRCIDNAIHSQAGLQLRKACNELMQKQGHLEETGRAKLTLAFNLPAKYVLHTVGPIISTATVSQEQMSQLASCYQSCLELALKKNIKSLAFCCISTGEFHFPNDLAAAIAIKTVRRFLQQNTELKVVFNVFKDEDKHIYQRLLKENKTP